MIRAPRSSLALLVAAGLSLLAARAPAQPPSVVRLRVESLFGQDVLLAEGWVPALVTVENLGASSYRGEVRVEVGDYAGSGMLRAAPLDLPARQTRTVVLPIFASSSGGFVRARYEVEGVALGRTETTVQYAPGGRSVVVLGDPPRLRGGLLDLDVYEELDASGRQVRVPVGVVRFDAATGDPMLPDNGLGWSTVKVLVAHAPALRRLSAPQRRAVEDWLRVGGRLLVFPRAPSDLQDEWLRSLAGESAPVTALAVDDPLVASGPEPYRLDCGEGQRSERFGCSHGVGLGRVYLASYDGTSSAAIESGAPRELVRSIYGAPMPVRAALPFGRGTDDASVGPYGGGSLSRVRRLLDPNEGFRPALGLVALVLLLYVVVVGPLNFRWVQRRGRPTLALLTTPAAAAVCVLLLLMVGYVGKGVQMRYRRVELVEAHEGLPRAAARRYTGFFSTRPGSYDLPGAGPDGYAQRIGGGVAQGPVYRHEGDAIALRDIRAGLWETMFLREDRFVGLGGAITFGRDGARLTTVTNRTSRPLRGAVVIDTVGAVYAIGDVAPGVTAPIPQTSSGSIGRYVGGEGVLRRLMRVAEEQAWSVEGLTELGGDSLAPTDAPVLYARLPPEGGRVADRFSPERDARWIRVTPEVDGAPVSLAPPPQEDPYAEPRPPPYPTPPLDDAGVEATPDGAASQVDGGAP